MVSFNVMTAAEGSDPNAEIARAVEAYRETNDVNALLERLFDVAGKADVDALLASHTDDAVEF